MRSRPTLALTAGIVGILAASATAGATESPSPLTSGDLTVEITADADGAPAITETDGIENAEIVVTYAGTIPEPEYTGDSPFPTDYTLAIVGSWMAPDAAWTSQDLVADANTFSRCEVKAASVALPELNDWREADNNAFWDRITAPCFDDVNLGPEWLKTDDGVYWGERVPRPDSPMAFEVPVGEDLWVALVAKSGVSIGDVDEPIAEKVEATFEAGGFAHRYASGGYYGTTPISLEVITEVPLRVDQPAQEPTSSASSAASPEVDDGGTGMWPWAAGGAALLVIITAGVVVRSRRRAVAMNQLRGS